MNQAEGKIEHAMTIRIIRGKGVVMKSGVSSLAGGTKTAEQRAERRGEEYQAFTLARARAKVRLGYARVLLVGGAQSRSERKRS